MIQRKTCSVPNCTRTHVAKGYCSAHWQRQHKGCLDPERPVTKSKPGALNGRWKGGQTQDGRGRVLVLKPDHPRATSWGYVYRYRLVMEEHLGRYLRAGEIVHHIDGDCSNDSLENLKLMTQSEHARLHLPDMHNDVWMIKQKNRQRKGGRFI